MKKQHIIWLLIGAIGLVVISYIRLIITQNLSPSQSLQSSTLNIFIGVSYFVFYALFAISFIKILRNKDLQSCELKRIYLVSIVLTIIFGLGLPLLTTDLFSNIIYEKIWLFHGANPYIFIPRDFAHDSAATFVSSRWLDAPLVYGPVHLYLMAIPIFFAGNSIVAALVYSKIFMVIITLLFTGLSYIYVKRHVQENFKSTTFAIMALNPILFIELTFQSHNDGIMALFILAGVLCLKEKYIILATIYFTLGILTKGFALFPLVFYGIWYLIQNKQQPIKVITTALKIIITSTIIILILYYPVWDGMETVLKPTRQLEPSFATLTRSFGEWIFFAFSSLGKSAQVLSYKIYTGIAWIVCLTITFIYIKKAKVFEDFIKACAIFFIFYQLFVNGWFQVQYLLWILPFFVVIKPTSRITTIFLTYTLLALLYFGLYLAWSSTVQEVISVAITNFLPIYLLIRYLRGKSLPFSIASQRSC